MDVKLYTTFIWPIEKLIITCPLLKICGARHRFILYTCVADRFFLVVFFWGGGGGESLFGANVPLITVYFLFGGGGGHWRPLCCGY
jgi:hypothetical protein